MITETHLLGREVKTALERAHVQIGQDPGSLEILDLLDEVPFQAMQEFIQQVNE